MAKWILAILIPLFAACNRDSGIVGMHWLKTGLREHGLSAGVLERHLSLSETVQQGLPLSKSDYGVERHYDQSEERNHERESTRPALGFSLLGVILTAYTFWNIYFRFDGRWWLWLLGLLLGLSVMTYGFYLFLLTIEDHQTSVIVDVDVFHTSRITQKTW